MFSLLLCLAAGIKPIITSSSDAKIENTKKLSSKIEGINYKKNEDVAAEALRLTGGKGVDYVVNNIGLSSIPSDLQALRSSGAAIALVGFLEGFEAKWSSDVLQILFVKAAKIQ